MTHIRVGCHLSSHNQRLVLIMKYHERRYDAQDRVCNWKDDDHCQDRKTSMTSEELIGVVPSSMIEPFIRGAADTKRIGEWNMDGDRKMPYLPVDFKLSYVISDG